MPQLDWKTAREGMFFPGRIGYENFQRATGIALVLPIELELPRPPVKPDACGPE